MRQKGFDEFDKDPNIRGSAYSFLHAPDDKGLVTLDIDFDEIDCQPRRPESVDRDRLPCGAAGMRRSRSYRARASALPHPTARYRSSSRRQGISAGSEVF